MYILHREQRIAKPLAEVFPFFERPENLGRLTPPWLSFVTLTPSPIEMRVGTEIDYAIRIFGIRQRWRSVIRAYDPPRAFVDEQVRGPYRFWRHRHEFFEENGQTRIVDHVEYELPFGLLGKITHALYVRWALKTIFDFREQAVTLLLS